MIFSHRMAPSVIKQRIMSVSVVTALSPLVLWFFAPSGETDLSMVLACLGLRLDGLLNAVLLPLLHTATLFSGSLYLKHLQGELSGKFISTCLKNSWCGDQDNLIFTLRAYVVAPITEEIVYRGVMVALCISAGKLYFKSF